MKEPDFDLQEFRCALRQDAMRSVRAAFETLARAAGHGGAIADDRQLRVCLALAPRSKNTSVLWRKGMKMNADSIPQNSPQFPTGRNSLSTQQLAAIELLAIGKSYSAVANAISVDRKTLYNWRKESQFAGELEERTSELWVGASDRLRALVHPAMDVLEKQLNDQYDRARFQAATALLKLANLRRG
jgi:transposase-like protein